MPKKKPVLLTTMPKAGTYLLALILEGLGLKNRGFHLAVDWAEDLVRFDERTCKEFPDSTRIPLHVNQALWCVRPGEFVFGHLPPHVIEPHFLNEYNIVYSYRDIREALVSEFYYYRDIRKDTDRLGFDENIRRLFLKFLKMFLDREMRLFSDLRKWHQTNNIFFIDFEKFKMNSDYAIKVIQELSIFIESKITKEDSLNIYKASKKTKTKTLHTNKENTNIWSIKADFLFLLHKVKYKL